MAAGPIVLVEPQSQGVAHSPFNAALLHTVAIAYPESPLCFHSLASHREEVERILQEVAPEIYSRIQWKTFSNAASPSVAARWMFHRRLFQHVLAAGQRTLFCSISRMQLLQLTRILRKRKAEQVRVVLHGELEQLEREQNRWLRPLSLSRILCRRKPAGLRYLLLSRSIRDSIPLRCAGAFTDAGICDHPYHFAASIHDAQQTPVLGIFGNAGEAHEIEAVVRQVKSVQPSICFRLIGFVSGPSTAERLRPLVEGVDTTPLARNTFIERAHGVTHALWLAPPGSYRLRGSGTFFDALSYGKPLIYTANPFVDAYHALEPGIGVRCTTLAEVASAILELANGMTAEGYAQTQAAILRLRERFTPSALAGPLARALDWD